MTKMMFKRGESGVKAYEVMSESAEAGEGVVMQQIVYKARRDRAKISEIFSLLNDLKYNKKAIGEYSFYEASLQQVFMEINNLSNN